MEVNQVVVRQAERKDIRHIYSMVKLLADYENDLKSVKVTEEDYLKLFDEKHFDSILAERDGQVLGMCIYYWAFSSWRGKMLYLDDFYVVDSERKGGIGQLLFDRLLQIGREEKAALIKWQVLDWNEVALNFYEKNKAIIEKNWWNGKIIFKHD